MSLIDLQTRLRPYQTIYNFRDFGGYAGRDGRAVVTDTLFRSAHLNNLGPNDMADIDRLGIATIVDLRHAPERERQPSKWNGGAAVLTQPAPKETQTVAPHEAFTQEKLHTAADAHGYMMQSYTKRPHDPSFVALHKDTLDAMTAETPGDDVGVLVHCAAGKDRTGTLCALIQGLLGVSEDDIMADYMLTETAVDIEAILQPAAVMFTQKYGRPIDADAIRPMFGVDPDFLKASLDQIGDFERYAVDTLGVSDAQLATLRSRYLAS